jgi:hypothetical protein
VRYSVHGCSGVDGSNRAGGHLPYHASTAFGRTSVLKNDGASLLRRTAVCTWLIALLLLASAAYSAAQPPADVDSAGEGAGPVGDRVAETSGPTNFDALVTRIVLDNLPHEITQDKDWGKTRQIWDGVRMRWEGNQLRTNRRWKTVNHGTWKKYQVRLIDPDQRFQIQVENPRALEDGRVGFEAQVDAALEVFGRLAQWERGVQLFSLSAEATAVVRLRVGCSVAMKLDPSRLPPDVRFEPEITSADLQLVQFRLHRISQASGPLVRELGSAVQDFVESKIADRRHQMVRRINRQIEKHQDDLRLSIHDLLASKWGDLAAEQLEATGEETP